MYLQGNLQPVFDALYHMGIIDPVLEMDWPSAMENLPEYKDQLDQVVDVVNSCRGNVKLLIEKLESFDQNILEFLAMEVAREFADFHSRHEVH